MSKKVIRSATDSTQNSVTYYAYDASGNVMAVYEKTFDSQLEYKYTVAEEHIYGSSRVGSYNNGNTVFDSDDETPAYAGTLDRASLRFEITDHLGNVRAVVGGTRTLVDGGGENLIENPNFDTHSGGLGTGWTWSNNAQGVYSIVTGNGFNGNAQRAERAAGKKRMVIKTGFTTVPGGQYRISFKYRSNVAFRITGHTGTANGFTENNIAADSVNVVTESYNKIAVGNEIGLYFDINKNDSLTYWLEIDDVEVVRTDVAGETYYQADIKFLGDYYPFGSQMPGRKFVASDGNYRYGFNGTEGNDEMYGDGNNYYTPNRIMDPRIGRWWSTDPVDHFDQSPYLMMSNSPLMMKDPNGDDDYFDYEGNYLGSDNQQSKDIRFVSVENWEKVMGQKKINYVISDPLKINQLVKSSSLFSEVKFLIEFDRYDENGEPKYHGTAASNSIVLKVGRHYMGNDPSNYYKFGVTLGKENAWYDREFGEINIALNRNGYLNYPELNNTHNFKSTLFHEHQHKKENHGGLNDLYNVKDIYIHLRVYKTQIQHPNLR